MKRAAECGATIGAHETPMVLSGRVVCIACYERVKGRVATGPSLAEIAAAARTQHRVPTTGRAGSSTAVGRSYRQRVGVRSFVLQGTLTVWTLLVWGGLAALFVLGFINDATNQNHAAMNFAQAYPRAATELAVLGMSYLTFVTFWMWVVVALPLYIAAVVTMDTERMGREALKPRKWE